MVSLNPSGDPADPESPAYGDKNFVGRAGLVRNLATRCGRGESVLLFGGPKLGKTSLLLQLNWLFSQPPANASARRLTTRYVDLRDASDCERFITGQTGPCDILLLDNCDRLAGRYLPRGPGLRANKSNGHPAQSIVWAGGRAWREYARSEGAGSDLVVAPLAILLAGEAAALVGSDLPPEHAAALLASGGTHPYVLRLLKASVAAAGTSADLDNVIRGAALRLAPFFESCFTEVQEPVERALLDSLVREGNPISPRAAARALGLPTIKPAADTLCYLGLICRWNLNEGARLHANCRLFNNWYLRELPVW